jgi:aldehyde dehydrogenase (NAD+)
MHPTQLGPARRKIHYEPIGVVGAITPWNVPFYLNVAETVPALNRQSSSLASESVRWRWR